MNWRKLRISVLVIFGLLSACSSGSTSGSPERVAADTEATDSEEVTLALWAGRPEMEQVFEAAGASFVEAHPNVSFTILTSDLRGFEQKLATALPSGTAGDIIVHGTNVMPGYIDAGLFAPVPAYLTEFANSGIYDDAVLSGAVVGGELRAVPLYVSRMALFYNQDFLGEAGIEGPPSTLDEIVDYAYRLAEHDDTGNVTRSGISLRLGGQGSGVAEKFEVMTRQVGRPFLIESDDGSLQPDIANDETNEVLQIHLQMLADGVDHPDIAHDTEAFLGGQTAMFVRESTVIVQAEAQAPELNYGAVALPNATRSSTISMWVPAASEHQELAWEFVDHLMQPEQQLLIPNAFGFLPARQDIDVSSLIETHPAFEAFTQFPDDFQQYRDPVHPRWDEAQTYYAEQLASTFLEYETFAGDFEGTASLLSDWDTEIRAILARQ